MPYIVILAPRRWSRTQPIVNFIFCDVDSVVCRIDLQKTCNTASLERVASAAGHIHSPVTVSPSIEMSYCHHYDKLLRIRQRNREVWYLSLYQKQSQLPRCPEYPVRITEAGRRQ